MWQVYVLGLTGKTSLILLDSSCPEKTTVEEFKKKVEEKTGVSPEHQKLIYGYKQLQNGTTLADYPPLGDQSNIQLVLRLPGGSLVRKPDPSLPRSKEPCMITGCDDTDDEPVYKLPCIGGHPMSSDGLMDYCWNEIRSIKSEIKCCLCGDVLSIDVIRRYGRASDVELHELEKGLARNFCLKSDTIQECPGCSCFCERQNTSKACVLCVLCTKNMGKPYHFCWNCLKPWKASPSAPSCGNGGQCSASDRLGILKTSPMIKVAYININVYEKRACPKCGTIIELTGGCKHMQCKACKQEFCFVCLRMRMGASWPCGAHNAKCELAPIQTRLPQTA